MKNIYFVLAIAALLVSCIKSNTGCEPLKPSAEEAQIVAYATANGINAIKDSSGIYYEIVEPGAGASPQLNSKIFVTYIGKRLDGTIFDKQEDASKTGWQLGQNGNSTGLIEGWQIMLPLIHKGGHIKMIIPSSYAYGCTGYDNIPPNEILFFDVTLFDVQ